MVVDISADLPSPSPVECEHGSELHASATLSTCPSSSGNVTDILATPPQKSEDQLPVKPAIVSAPSEDISWQSIEQRIYPDVSYEIEEFKNIRDYVPEWTHDDVDELIILSPKSKTITLDTIPEDSEIHSVTASDFDLIRSMPGGEEELYLGRRSGTTKLYAVKIIRRSLISDASIPADHARTEQAALRLLTESQAPFSTKLQWSFHDHGVFYMVTDFCPGGSLQMLLQGGSVSQEHVRFYSAQIVEGISALHAAGIVHRELRPECVLIDSDGHIALSDFGSALFSCDAPRRPGRPVGVRGTGLYHAPEVILGWAHDRAVDWWGFGTLLAFMLTGQHPFFGANVSSHVHRSILESHILHGEVAMYVPESFAQDLISQCLQRNPVMRITEEGVKMHAYFGDVDWQQVRHKKSPAPFVPKYEDTLYGVQSFPTGLNSQGQWIVEGLSFTWGLDDTGADAVQEEDSVLVSESKAGAHLVVDSLETVAVSPAVNDTLSVKSRSEEDDNGLSIPAELGGLRAKSSSPRITHGLGTLRKYSSLNFDLDTLASAPGGQDDIPGPSPRPSNKLRKSQSHSNYGSPLSLQEITDSSRWRNKLRKKSTPNLMNIAPPPLALPQGIEQIGNGIGYTRRSDPSHSRLSIATLTPRTCYALFSGGRLPSMPAKYEQRKDGRLGQRFTPAGIAVMDGPNQSEDQMDAVMREMYGSTSNLGMSTTDVSAAGADPRTYAALARPCIGLGYGETPFGRSRSHSRGGSGARDMTPTPRAPAEFRSLSPASTLRLVSPVATPRMELS